MEKNKKSAVKDRSTSYLLMTDRPVLIFAICVVALWLSARMGVYWCTKSGKLEEDERADLGVILTAALTLLGLIIGFSFSMAISRYDQRKYNEAAEANAIGTEFARAGLLPETDASRMRELLRKYLHQRVLFFRTRNLRGLQQIDLSTAQLQRDLWSTVQAYASTERTAMAGLVVSGMNDVLNSQAYTQAAWWNRIPVAAWVLMVAIAICCNCILGYAARRPQGRTRRFLLLPLIVSTSFFLIADIDSPRGGVIRVRPQNLESLRLALNASTSNTSGVHLNRHATSNELGTNTVWALHCDWSSRPSTLT
jgi:hypothetical protein